MADDKGQLDLYGGRPPFVRGSSTSEAAADSMTNASGKIRRQVLEHIVALGPHGATCDEIEDALDLRHQTASARVRELALLSRILDSGRKRPTRSGRNAVVWVAPPSRSR